MKKRYLLAVLTAFIMCFLPFMSHGKLSTSTTTVHAQSVGWQKVNGTWYYYSASGVKQTGWLKEGNTWYYLKSNGAMATGWEKVNGTWYYLEPSGAMKTGWLKEGSTWYYLKPSGAMATGWEKVNGTWYYLEPSGAMKTGWLKEGSTWYYLKPSGAMATGWEKVKNVWYYFYNSGAMATNTVIDGWSIDENGVGTLPKKMTFTGYSFVNTVGNFDGWWIDYGGALWGPYGTWSYEYITISPWAGGYSPEPTLDVYISVEGHNVFPEETSEQLRKALMEIIPSGASTIASKIKANARGNETYEFDGRKVVVSYGGLTNIEIHGKK